MRPSSAAGFLLSKKRQKRRITCFIHCVTHYAPTPLWVRSVTRCERCGASTSPAKSDNFINSCMEVGHGYRVESFPRRDARRRMGGAAHRQPEQAAPPGGRKDARETAHRQRHW